MTVYDSRCKVLSLSLDNLGVFGQLPLQVLSNGKNFAVLNQQILSCEDPFVFTRPKFESFEEHGLRVFNGLSFLPRELGNRSRIGFA